MAFWISAAAGAAKAMWRGDGATVERKLAPDGKVYFSYADIASAVSSAVPRDKAFGPDVIVVALKEMRALWPKSVDGAEVHGYGTLRLPGGEAYEGYFRDHACTGPGIWLRDAHGGRAAAAAADDAAADEPNETADAADETDETAGAAEAGGPLMARDVRGERVRCILGTFKAGLLVTAASTGIVVLCFGYLFTAHALFVSRTAPASMM